MKALFLTVLATLSLTVSYSQSKQSNWWYFGSKAGLNFNKIVSGLPTAVANGSMITQEGCASISDAKGNLLFYTDGATVWNKNHSIMPNGTGLLGNNSSTQSALIVPFPGNKNKYYVFTVWTTSATGLRYSVVDMSLSSGLGSVVSTTKNSFIFIPTCERVAATARTGGGYWVLAQHQTSNKYSAYAVTSSGVSSTPVSTTIGPIPQSTGIGYMKFSPRGGKLGVAYHKSKCFLMDFDKNTGKLSNLLLDTTNGAYGLEFSPNGKLFYTCPANGTIRQYDANAISNTAFVDSAKSFITTGVTSYGIQLGPDGKIYVTNYMKNNLTVIHKPNVAGIGCNLSLNGPTIPTGAHSRLGFPNFPSNLLVGKQLYISNFCEKAATQFSLNDTTGIDSVLINFGDSSSGSLNWTKILPDTHTYAKAGTYLVTSFLYSLDSGKLVVDTILDSIVIANPPVVQLGNDTVVCEFDSIEVNIQSKAAYSFYWNDSVPSKFHKIDKVGNYWVVASNECGVSSDTILIKQVYRDTLDLGNDTIICFGDTITLTADTTHFYPSSYSWNWGQKTREIEVYYQGGFIATMYNKCGTVRDTIFVGVDSVLNVQLPSDTAICKGDTLQIKSKNTLPNYLWNTGFKDSSILVFQSGNYSLSSTNQCGTFMDQIYVALNQPIVPTIRRNNDTLISSSAKTYQWYSSGVLIPNKMNQKHLLDSIGSYTVYTTDSNGCKAESKAWLVEVIYGDTAKTSIFEPYNNFLQGEIKLFPNPVIETLTIEFDEIENLDFTLQVFDNKGALVLSDILSVSKQENEKTIDFLNLAKGEYLIRLSSSNSVSTFKVLRVD